MRANGWQLARPAGTPRNERHRTATPSLDEGETEKPRVKEREREIRRMAVRDNYALGRNLAVPKKRRKINQGWVRGQAESNLVVYSQPRSDRCLHLLYTFIYEVQFRPNCMEQWLLPTGFVQIRPQLAAVILITRAVGHLPLAGAVN